MEWAAIISALAGLLLYILKRYDAGQPKRDEDQRYDDVQQGRKDIANVDTAAVNERIDRLLFSDRNSERQSGSEITAERIGSVSGLVDPGRNPGKDSGKS